MVRFSGPATLPQTWSKKVAVSYGKVFFVSDEESRLDKLSTDMTEKSVISAVFTEIFSALAGIHS